MQVVTLISASYCSPSHVLWPCLSAAEKKIWGKDDFVGYSNCCARRHGVLVSVFKEGNLGFNLQRKRRVVEHVCLIRGKEGLDEEQEKGMLDWLYTTQYQMRGIVAISLGRISGINPENFTHALFMRFQTREDLGRFYENPCFIGVLKQHVDPFCHGYVNLDFESEVEDDILPIFRKGEDFNYGLELIILLAFSRSSLGGPAEDAMISFANMAMEFPSLIVQATAGTNFNMNNMEYSHGAVIRFRSSEAFNIFMSSPEYDAMWTSKFSPFLLKALFLHFPVDPIGTELM